MSRSKMNQAGSALVSVLVLTTAIIAVSSALADATRQVTEEVRVRRDVQCARFAALAGLALGTGPADRADAIDGAVESLQVFAVRRASAWCVVRSIARCGEARRTMERSVGAEACD